MQVKSSKRKRTLQEDEDKNTTNVKRKGNNFENPDRIRKRARRDHHEHANNNDIEYSGIYKLFLEIDNDLLFDTFNDTHLITPLKSPSPTNNKKPRKVALTRSCTLEQIRRDGKRGESKIFKKLK